MTRYIDAGALKETINAHDYVLKDCTNSTDKGMFTVGIMQAIDAQPTVEPSGLTGWICPICGRGLSPYTVVCPCQGGKGWEITCG